MPCVGTERASLWRTRGPLLPFAFVVTYSLAIPSFWGGLMVVLSMVMAFMCWRPPDNRCNCGTTRSDNARMTGGRTLCPGGRAGGDDGAHPIHGAHRCWRCWARTCPYTRIARKGPAPSGRGVESTPGRRHASPILTVYGGRTWARFLGTAGGVSSGSVSPGWLA